MEIDFLQKDFLHKEGEIYLIKQDLYKEQILEHFKSLSPEDRYSRFGFSVTDEYLDNEYKISHSGNYIFSQLKVFTPIDYLGDSFCFAVFKDSKIIGLLQLFRQKNDGGKNGTNKFTPDFFKNHNFELGISVSTGYQGQGIGSKLFAKGVLFAKTIGAAAITTYCLSSNIAVQKMAKKNGLSILFEGTERVGNLEIDQDEIIKNPSIIFSEVAKAIESNSIMFFDKTEITKFYSIIEMYNQILSFFKWNAK